MHRNLMACVIFGRSSPVFVTNGSCSANDDIVCIKPDAPHRVSIGVGGAEVLYLDGLQFPDKLDVFSPMDRSFRGIPDAVKAQKTLEIGEFRDRLSVSTVAPDPDIMDIVHQLYAEPMKRLSQEELSLQLDLERTQALRHFKWNTGQTFRKFKIWAAIIATVRNILNGQTIATAGIDSGFSDAAHVARTARTIFGVTPTAGMGNLANFISV